MQPMQDDAMSASSEKSKYYWQEWFLSLKGNEYFCEVDEEYILDKFNLTGLNSDVPYYSQAYDWITDSLDDDTLDDDVREEVENNARHLFGLIHARYILTTRGINKMVEKFKYAEFGKCPRVLCGNQSTLPVGLTDVPGVKPVKLYCPKCEDLYSPPSRRHQAIDGAYFGTSFPHLLLQMNSTLIPVKTQDQYIPKIFGFKLHEASKERRRQNELKEEAAKKWQMLT